MKIEPSTPEAELDRLRAMAEDRSLPVVQSEKREIQRALSVALEPRFLKSVVEEVGPPRQDEQRAEYITRATAKMTERLIDFIGR